MSYLFYAILVYLLYRFVVGFVLPVFRTTSQVKRQFNNMRQQAEAYQNQQGSQSGNTNNGPVNQKPKYDIEGEYIKFEDVKE